MFVRFKSDGYIRDHEVSMAGFNASYYAVDIKSGILRDLALYVTGRVGGGGWGVRREGGRSRYKQSIKWGL